MTPQERAEILAWGRALAEIQAASGGATAMPDTDPRGRLLADFFDGACADLIAERGCECEADRKDAEKEIETMRSLARVTVAFIRALAFYGAAVADYTITEPITDALADRWQAAVFMAAFRLEQG